ncbi:MAG: hypothetical protein FWC98_05685, partial [Bacteroidales bacterium]|nr:hypothetical protein [Bacteroidales bacterium]
KNRIFVVMQNITFSKISAFIVLLGSIILFESCRQEPTFNTDPNFRLEFSSDTLKFDTVFTSLGSTTFWLQVYNRSNQDADIQTIALVGGLNSPFRMNVSGDTSLVQSHVRLRAQDSLFIFITVTIDPNDSTRPFLEEDFIRFSFNNRTQDVVLQAFGQNAHYHIPTDTLNIFCPIINDTIRLPYSIAVPNDFSNSEKPHVIFGFLNVKSGDILTLNAGTRLHLAPNSGLLVAEGGSLRINGTIERPVIFDGMRMDAAYRNITGQWNRIWLSPGSVDNSIHWAVIQNGRIGLLVDSMSNLNHPLIIENTIINNMQIHGIFAKNAAIRGSNLQVSNAGERLLALIGGDYTFEHCTFANYFSASPPFSRRHASVLLDTTSLHPVIRANFTSCIIFGMLQDELEIRSSQTENINFSYCNIRTQRNRNDRMFQNSQINENPRFRHPSNVNSDFDIAPNSPVIGSGRPSPTNPNVFFDLKGRWRNNPPTIGAYEFTDL